MSKTIAYYIEKLDLEDLKLIRDIWNDGDETHDHGPDEVELSQVIFLDAKTVRFELSQELLIEESLIKLKENYPQMINRIKRLDKIIGILYG